MRYLGSALWRRSARRSGRAEFGRGGNESPTANWVVRDGSEEAVRVGAALKPWSQGVANGGGWNRAGCGAGGKKTAGGGIMKEKLDCIKGVLGTLDRDIELAYGRET